MSIAPTFSIHYNQGYAARPAPVTKDFGAWKFTPSDSELAIHEEIATIRSRYDALPLHMKHPQDQLNHWMGLFTQQARAYDNFLQSTLGFEPTEHSDAPPYIPTTTKVKAQPCIDFGFEPTEASE
jgi:GTP cyclohydrolase III